MNSKKVLISLLIVTAIAGVAALQVRNKELIQGQIFGDKTVKTQEDVTTLPDLKPTLTTEGVDQNGNLRVRIKVENIGEGPVLGTNPYSYTIYINEVEILTNTDAFSRMDKGDSFSFIYPIDKELYQYEDSGKVKVVVDADGKIEETDKSNNTSEAEYKI